MMSAKRKPLIWRMPSKLVDQNSEAPIKYAIVDHVHKEVLSANHLVIGSAFNSKDEDFIPNDNLVVVATQKDKILGEVKRNGVIKESSLVLPETIWSGPKHPYFNPSVTKASQSHV